MRAPLFALVLLSLAACGTPQERCIQRETRDLRIVDRLIGETETNLRRGYALEEVTVWRTQWVLCDVQPRSALKEGEAPPPPRMCLEDVADTVTRPKAINLAQEREKLAGLQDKRQDLARAAESASAQCRASFPE